MPYFKDFICNDCKHVEEVSKKQMIDDFVYTECVKCGSGNVSMVFAVLDTDTCEGHCGNAKTKYNNSMTYHPSKYGKFKGTRVK